MTLNMNITMTMVNLRMRMTRAMTVDHNSGHDLVHQDSQINIFHMVLLVKQLDRMDPRYFVKSYSKSVCFS